MTERANTTPNTTPNRRNPRQSGNRTGEHHSRVRHASEFLFICLIVFFTRVFIPRTRIYMVFALFGSVVSKTYERLWCSVWCSVVFGEQALS